MQARFTCGLSGLREGAPLERIWAPRIDQSDPPRSWPLPCDRALTSLELAQKLSVAGAPHSPQTSKHIHNRALQPPKMPFDLIVRGNELIWPCRGSTDQPCPTHSLPPESCPADRQVCGGKVQHLEGLRGRLLRLGAGAHRGCTSRERTAVVSRVWAGPFQRLVDEVIPRLISAGRSIERG